MNAGILQRDPSAPFGILLVEDNEAHAELITRGLEVFERAHTIHHVLDGEQALDFLERLDHSGAAAGLDCIILDIKLPRINGLEVLKRIKADPVFRQVPVVILTTSSAASDVQQAYEHHGNSYLTKPVRADEFGKLMQELGNYWMKRNLAAGHRKGKPAGTGT